jgi:energy-coupling factor transporter transmembrane protein EcfT
MNAVATSTAPPREGKDYVRTFLFSMKIDSPLARLHVVSKVVSILSVSLIVVHLMNANHPDPMGAAVLAILSLAALLFGGVIAWLFRSYLLVLFPMLGTLFVTWLIFNPDPGTRVYLTVPLYDGSVDIALSLSLLVLVASPIIYHRLRGTVFGGLLIGLVAAVLLGKLGPNPRLLLAEVPFFHPLSLVASDANLVVALTKVLGYAAMVFVSLTLIMTTRDAEVIGALRQARVPYAVSFFTSIWLRSLSMAMLDYGTIRQAQVARGVDLQRKSILGKVLDLARVSVPLIVAMIRRSTEVGDAVMARGMVNLRIQPSTFREIRPIRGFDIALILIFILLGVAVLGLRINLTELLGLNLPVAS